MYERHPPNLKLEETLSSPFSPAEVVGFTGRNTFFGTDVVALKEDSLPDTPRVENGVVPVPSNVADLIEREHDLVVLNDFEVLVLSSSEFQPLGRPHTVEKNGVSDTATLIDRGDFISWPEGLVEVSS